MLNPPMYSYRPYRSESEKAARRVMAQTWRAIRAYSPSLARRVFIAHRNAVNAAIDDIWSEPTSDGLANLLGKDPSR